MADRPGRAAHRRIALVSLLAAALATVPLASAAGALAGDLPGDDPTEPVSDVLDEPVDEPVTGDEDLADDVADTLTETVDEATGDAGEPVEDAAGTVVDTVEDLPPATAPAGDDNHPEPPVVGGDDSGTGGDRGDRQQATDTGDTGDSGDGGDETGAATTGTGGGQPGEEPDDHGSSFAGGPAGGLAFVGLRSTLRPGSAPDLTFATGVLPPVVSAPEPAEAPMIAGAEQQELASLSTPRVAAAGWPTAAGDTGGDHVPAPLFATAAGLVLALAGAHALHAAGYLRPSFVRAAD